MSGLWVTVVCRDCGEKAEAASHGDAIRFVHDCQKRRLAGTDGGDGRITVKRLRRSASTRGRWMEDW